MESVKSLGRGKVVGNFSVLLGNSAHTLERVSFEHQSSAIRRHEEQNRGQTQLPCAQKCLTVKTGLLR